MILTKVHLKREIAFQMEGKSIGLPCADNLFTLIFSFCGYVWIWFWQLWFTSSCFSVSQLLMKMKIKRYKKFSMLRKHVMYGPEQESWARNSKLGICDYKISRILWCMDHNCREFFWMGGIFLGKWNIHQMSGLWVSLAQIATAVKI